MRLGNGVAEFSEKWKQFLSIIYMNLCYKRFRCVCVRARAGECLCDQSTH